MEQLTHNQRINNKQTVYLFDNLNRHIYYKNIGLYRKAAVRNIPDDHRIIRAGLMITSYQCGKDLREDQPRYKDCILPDIYPRHNEPLRGL